MMGSRSALCQALVLLATWFFAACGEEGDSGYRESTETSRVPTVHLVIDHEDSRSTGDWRQINVDYHIQADRPMERDIFVLVRQLYAIPETVRHGLPPGRVHEFSGIHVVSNSRDSFLVVILAGRTQSAKLNMRLNNTSSFGVTGKLSAELTRFIPGVVATLPDPQERARLLPMRFDYRDSGGRKQTIEMLVEYPFNPYRVGNPKTIVRKWNDQ